MLMSDIIESCACHIERKIGNEWKHEVGILGTGYNYANFEIDGREYVMILHEIKDGECFAMYLKEE